MTKKTFMRGALILGAAGIVVKILGAFFRIPLANMIGSEGMSYYQAVYPIYVLLLTIATAGIPVAISRMVSERIAFKDYYGAHRIFKIALAIMAVIGFVLFGACFFFAESIVGMFNSLEGAVYAMRAIAPALLFVPMMASFRGYFQGMQNMRPTAFSQIFEQLFRVIIGLAAAYLLVSSGTQMAAAGATFGASAGAFAGLLVVFLIYLLLRSTKSYKIRIRNSHYEFSAFQDSAGEVVKKIFIIAIPITIGAAIMPIMNTIDVAIVTNRLTATGWSAVEARSMYGQLTGFASPIINLPQVITQAVAISLVPAISTAFSLKDDEMLTKNVNMSLRVTMIIGLPCTVGLMTLSKPIMLLLYPNQYEDAISAAPALFILAIGVVFLASIQTLTGVLQGIGKQVIPVRNLLIGATAKIIITYTLTSIPEFNIKGAAIGTVVAYIIAASMNYYCTMKYTKTKFNIEVIFVKPIISVTVMGIVAWGSYTLLSMFAGNSISTILAIMFAGCTYVILLFVTKAIREEELAEFPKGDKLVKVYRRISGSNGKR